MKNEANDKKLNVKRTGSGFYEVTVGDRSFQVLRNDQLDGPDKWIYYDTHDNYHVSDPLPTKKYALESIKLVVKQDAQ